MSAWKKVGDWLTSNAGTGAALVGSLLTGNVHGAVAAGVSLVKSATGESDPEKVLVSFQNDPATIIRLRELAQKEEESIRQHLRLMEEARLKDEQEAHREQQETIRSGDNAEDEFVRHTRPLMARRSWWAATIYVILFEGVKAAGHGTGAEIELAIVLGSPAAAYLGFRSVDKLGGLSRWGRSK